MPSRLHPAPQAAPAVRPSIRLDLANGGRLGPGKMALLEAVGRTGSISAAGRDLGMSYRRAWLLLDSLNRTFDAPVVTAAAGGAGGGGAQVTDLGQALIAAYRGLEAEVAAAAAIRLAPVLGRLAADPGAPVPGED
jgi:molybdate transport system regulatory protein